jgi:hypothetical protein
VTALLREIVSESLAQLDALPPEAT